MSAQVKVIPRDERLRVTARYQHETLEFGGNIFEFIEHLMAKRLTGVGTFKLHLGGVRGLEFDLRELVIDETPDSMP